MSKTRCWITFLLALTTSILVNFILVGWHLIYNDQTLCLQTLHNQEPTYTAVNSSTVIYNQAGNLNYKLVSDKITYFSTREITWIDHPLMTIYDSNKVPSWSVCADKARLTKDRMLYLYGHVKVNNLTGNTQLLKQIKTDNTQVNLVTQDIQSDNKVILYGRGFTSIGMKIRGNFRTETAELIEKVTTYYEVSMQ